MSSQTEMFCALVADRLGEIAKVLPPCYNLTLVARNPDNPDGTFFITCDDQDQLIEHLISLRDKIKSLKIVPKIEVKIVPDINPGTDN